MKRQNPAHGEVSAQSKLCNSILADSSTEKQALNQRSLQIQTNFHQLNLIEPDQPTIPMSPCPSCGTTAGVQIAGSGPHYAGLKCANCGRWIKWLGKPKSGGAA